MLITSKEIDAAIREERIQCAVELCLDLADDDVQWLFVKGLLTETITESLHSVFLDLQRVRCDISQTEKSILCVISNFLLKKPFCHRHSHMSIEEKSDLLEEVRESLTNNSDEKRWVDDILHLVRSDESLSSLNLRSMPSELQGLVLFLGHNEAPSRVLELRRVDFKELAPESFVIAAFLVGLRFRRQILSPERPFVALRDSHILKTVAILNNSKMPELPDVLLTEDGVSVNGAQFRRRDRCFAIEELDNGLTIFVASKKRDELKFNQINLIATKNTSSIGSIKLIKRKIAKSEYYGDIVKSLSFEDFSKIKIFGNRKLYDYYFATEDFAEIKFKDAVLIRKKNGEVTKIEKPSIKIRLADLDGLLKPFLHTNKSASPAKKSNVNQPSLDGLDAAALQIPGLDVGVKLTKKRKSEIKALFRPISLKVPIKMRLNSSM